MKKVIGIDLGGTFIRAGISSGRDIAGYVKVKTPKTQKEILKKICELIYSFDLKKIKGIGVGVPGFTKDGFVKKTPNLPIKNFDLKKFLEKKFEKKVYVENDAKCIALSEIKFETKKRNVLILTLGTGIGGAIIVNGEIYFGNGYAGEVGHMMVGENKDWESLWKDVLKKMKREFGEGFLIKEIINSKSKKAKALLDEAYETLALGIGSLISAIDPEEIILMGGIREAGNKFIAGINKKLKTKTINPKIPPIRWSKIPHPGVFGAILLTEKIG